MSKQPNPTPKEVGAIKPPAPPSPPTGRNNMTDKKIERRQGYRQKGLIWI